MLQPNRAESLPNGVAILQDPALNKGTAFTEAERDTLHLRGLLPPHVSSQEQQLARVLENFRRQPTDLEKYVNLRSLHDRNETLFFRLLIENPDEMTPIVYTPTVGLACQRYTHIYQRPHGVFVSSADRGRVEQVLANWPRRDVAIIVVSDGERILGLGDLGANGMGIPVGKLALYTACAGVPPSACLPVLLDVGTNNSELLDDALYIGLHQPRLRGAGYDALVEEFVAAATKLFPGVVIQFEDFATHNAFRLLQKYRDRVPTFNDDIQGTAAVVVAGILSALRITGGALTEQTLLFQGAGEAATGIADLAVEAMIASGMDRAKARQRCWLVDSQGLVVKGRAGLAAHKLPYAHEHAPATGLLDAVKALQPTAIIGVAAVGGAFTEEVVRTMAAINKRPMVFALSNPTSKSECTAAQAYRWSDGRALFACGSPFDPVTLGGRTLVPRQGNNSYIFPGVGLGVITSRANRVTDEMFMAAARTLAEQVTTQDLEQGSLYPPLKDIREVSAHIAAAVAGVAYRRGLAQEPQPADLLAYARSRMYQPRYADYVAA
ncbi:MAG TPA: NAD-dependent malic enzyme [Casimicrobiaceae bacterium]|nr:NAD-dependent malic enzyme [Casimicrobiaceae bacterium]